ncbi:MAG: N-acyl-D-amino-acid deacylase family protein [Myxococcota bacterium]
MNDIAIRGGTVVDGTGAPARRADVGIRDGRVFEIDDSVRGAEEIDASDRLVVPGFVDIHTHYDAQVLWDPALEPSSHQGVTSVVAGNCGYSLAPTKERDRASLMRTLDKVEDMRLATLEAGVSWDFESYGEYLDLIETRGLGIHFGGYVGHTPVRLYVMGDDAYEREATEAEIDQMKRIVADSIRAGALGFSSDRAGFHLGDGGRPVPSVVSSQAEVEALLGVAGEIGQGVLHVAAGENFDWVYDAQRRIGRVLNWSSILTYPETWKSRAPWREKLERHLTGRAAGADVSVQVTCRPIVQRIVMREPTSFYQMPSFKELVATPESERGRVFADPEWRARVFAEFDSGDWIDPGWATFTIAESRVHAELVGRSVLDLARERGGTPWDVVCDLALEENLATRFEIVFANDDVEGVSELLRGEGCVLGLSDAGAHVGQICDAVMPTDFLAGWVRDRSLLSIEDGIRKVSGEVARVAGLGDRGTLEAGRIADVVVLDWERLSPGPERRTFDFPAGGEHLTADTPIGVETILVAGVPTRREGKSCLGSLDRLPGRVLRSTPA